MGCIPYQTVRDAQACLQRNIILYKNWPHYVSSVDGPNGVVGLDDITLCLVKLSLKSTGDNKTVNVTLDDPDINVTNVQIGFTNLTLDALWCSRIPIRGNAQGLAESNLNWSFVTNTGAEERVSFSRLIGKDTFSHQFSGSYPTVPDILASFEQDKNLRSRAFHRQYAISRDEFRKDFVVHYRQRAVGFGALKDRKLYLTADYKHLKERFEECGFNVAA